MQCPFVKSISGCPNVFSFIDGRRHSPGQFFTQSSQPTHVRSKTLRLPAPGGSTVFARSGDACSEIGANPPSVVFSTVSAAASSATP